MTKKAKTNFRVVGGDGGWLAYHQFLTPKSGPYQFWWWAPTGPNTDRPVTAVQGRSPSEALYRLKRQLVAA